MIINKTVNDLKLNLNVSRNIAGKKSRLLLGIASLVCALAGAVTLTLELLASGDGEPDYFFPVLCFVLGVFFCAFAIGFNDFMKLILKKNLQGKQTENTFTFTDDGY